MIIFSSNPLKYYKTALEQHNVKTFKEFDESSDVESFIAGTILSLKEKKTSKGAPFSIIKFSDTSKVYEIFLFGKEALIQNECIGFLWIQLL